MKSRPRSARKSTKPGPSASRVFYNALVVTQDERRRVLTGGVWIYEDKIKKILSLKPGAKPDRSKFPKGTEFVDAGGHAILPGFVQAHVHLCQTLFRNQADDLELLDWLSKRIWVMEAAHTEETLHTSALLGIHELLSSGTTCILDMGTVRHTSAIIDAVRESGIRASVGKCLMDHPKTTPVNLREATPDALSEASQLFTRYNGTENDRIRISYAPRFVISCTERLLAQVARLSRDSGAIVHTHASENLKEIQMVKDLVGCENVEYLDQMGLTSERLVLAHCIWLKPNEKDLLRRSGTHVVHCPSSNLKLASGLAHVPEMRRLGINVALGADGAPCNNNLNMFTEMRLAALIHKPQSGPRSMRAAEVLDMATRDGARALGWQDKIGSIEEGKQADLICIDLSTPENAVVTSQGKTPTLDDVASSIVYSSGRHHLMWTMVGGRVVYDGFQVPAIPTAPLLARVQKARAKIGRSL